MKRLILIASAILVLLSTTACTFSITSGLTGNIYEIQQDKENK